LIQQLGFQHGTSLGYSAGAAFIKNTFKETQKAEKTINYHHHHHHTPLMELGHLLTRSGHTYPEVSSKVYHDSFCQLGSSVTLGNLFRGILFT